MDKSILETKIKGINRAHLVGVAILIVLAIASTLTGEEYTYTANTGATIAKSLLMIFTFVNIPLIWWLYDKNVKNKELSEESRQENLLKWSCIRILFWFTNTIMCIFLFNFDGDRSIFDLGVIAFIIYAFAAHANAKDIEIKQQDTIEN